ncbi:aminotransferase class I/II-fold pyridoxal phosphate-dependent enzyme [candidate division KSB1 bacterium]
MWFKRMPLEQWFDAYQYEVEYDIGESAVKFLSFDDLNIDLGNLPLRYGHHRGRPDLREKIAGMYDGLSADNILVTSAGSEAIFALSATLLTPGDHVIIEHPTYPSLYSAPRSLGGEVSFLSLRFDNNFNPDLEELESLITDRTKLINFTHPNNPTGSVISPETLEKIIGIAEAYDIYFLFDETYRDLAYGEPLPTVASLSPKAISISSLSKCYGLPGIRTGWLAAQSNDILEGVLTVREQITISNSAINEEIASIVLDRKDIFLEKGRQHAQKNLEIVTQWIEQRDFLEWILPKAGVVALPRFRDISTVDPENVYKRLAEHYKTFVVPGRCFEIDNRYFRIGYGGDAEEIITGLNNLEKAYNDTAA